MNTISDDMESVLFLISTQQSDIEYTRIFVYYQYDFWWSFTGEGLMVSNESDIRLCGNVSQINSMITEWI